MPNSQPSDVSEQQTICWGATLAEIAVILASRTREWSVSQSILATLAAERNAEQIQVSLPFLLGTVMIILGAFVRDRCYRALGTLFTFEMSIRKDHRLVTSGPYSIVRHPGYTGVLLLVLGIVCCHTSPVSVCACPCVGVAEWMYQGSWALECGAFNSQIGQIAAGLYVVLVTVITGGLLSRMSKEDEALKSAFGQAWTDWARRVPYKLVPGVL